MPCLGRDFGLVGLDRCSGGSSIFVAVIAIYSVNKPKPYDGTKRSMQFRTNGRIDTNWKS